MIDGSLRVINGFIEHNYERVAQLLPQADEREIREQLFDIEQCVDPDDYNDGYEAGVEDGKNFSYEQLDKALERFVKQSRISLKQAHEILEAME